ncbi:MAG: hypothetical protein ACRDT6_13065 [Micromonosporaceae bacterium]
MPVITIDHQVTAALEERGRFGDTFNDVLRQVLGLPAVPRYMRNTGTPSRYPLKDLIELGQLHDGQVLVWHRPQLAKTHFATVDSSGCMVTADGVAHRTPNMAATAVAGYPAKGWRAWCTEDGTTLAALCERLGR